MFDWLSLTLPEDDGTPGSFLPGADEWEWVEQERGFNGYRKEWRCGSLRFAFDGPVAGMGVHLMLTGQGCREVEARMASPSDGRESLIVPSKVGPATSQASMPFDWQGWANYLVNRGAHCTRLDLAIDDKQGILELETIAGTIDRGELTRESTSRPRYIYSSEPGQGRRLETIEVGKRRSESQVTIYDKAVEQGEEGHWVRVEMRLRRDRAQAGLALFACGGVTPLLGVLRKTLCFREHTNDTNRGRWPVARWWLQLLGAVNPISLSVAPRMKTIIEKYQWLGDYIAPTIALVFRWKGPEALADLVANGQRRLSRAQLAMLAGGGGGSLALSAT